MAKNSENASISSIPKLVLGALDHSNLKTDRVKGLWPTSFLIPAFRNAKRSSCLERSRLPPMATTRQGPFGTTLGHMILKLINGRRPKWKTLIYCQVGV